MSKNLFETYKVNGRTYTDNLGENALISISKKQYIEYEQQKEEIERLNNIIKEQGLEDKPNYYVKGLEGSLKEYQEEIERLNNIINELERDFESKIQGCTIEVETTTNDFYCRLHIATLKRWLNKIKELKGSDKK